MKQTIYPKTKRMEPTKIQITEKLNGSNIGFFKLNGELIIAQRNNIFTFTEITSTPVDGLYKGLKEFLFKYGNDLKDKLQESSGFFAEWLLFNNVRIHMFAKANLKLNQLNKYEAYNILYDRNLFIYPFIDQLIPEYINIVPLVTELDRVGIDLLDTLYDDYSIKVNRPVEGFIIIYNNQSIEKYVRFKDNKATQHTWRK